MKIIDKLMDKINSILSCKNGKLLSSNDEYKNANTKLRWACAKDHLFEMTWNKVQQGQWCPKCAGFYMTMEDIQLLAASRGGKCLSKEYTKCILPLVWECAKGHRWTSSLNNVKNSNTWCPHCVENIGEEICRKYFEFIFNEKFHRIRPAWLINEEGYRLELDGYCDNLSLAFEYNGPHHYKNTKYSQAKLSRIKKNDKVKKKICKEKNIKLIVIPFVDGPNKNNEIKKNIYEILTAHNFIIPKEYDTYSVLSCDIYEQDPLIELKNIAISHGGYCLSNSYDGVNSKLEWVCKYKHCWEAIPMTIKRGVWCPTCKEPNKMSTEDIAMFLCEIKDKEENIFYKRILSRSILLLKGL